MRLRNNAIASSVSLPDSDSAKKVFQQQKEFHSSTACSLSALYRHISVNERYVLPAKGQQYEISLKGIITSDQKFKSELGISDKTKNR